ncbi:GNAT family N-acetyltransferase [Anianabacter salinae]|uniref:GNAT family N-acetyltransferase n=1 Tax=Anianabacter salinae TaxID=2851023 RepID=UPI00225E6B8D|nr:GNAT family N-acetyltransferase [Anianabacter salinae]MBV0913718.1 GNAT family N-acetyltransferase [Anianabacter salinae]
MLAVRPATGADHDAIWAILKPVFRAGDTYTIDPAIPRADALAYWTAHRCYVAEDAGDVLGTYYLKPNQQGGGAHVANCGYATLPAARGRGIASAMCAHSLDAARAAGFRAMQFNFVVSTNTGAIRLWEKHGFDTVGRLPRAFDHPGSGEVDALVMHRFL